MRINAYEMVIQYRNMKLAWRTNIHGILATALMSYLGCIFKSLRDHEDHAWLAATCHDDHMS
jgi:hypothetical protein